MIENPHGPKDQVEKLKKARGLTSSLVDAAVYTTIGVGAGMSIGDDTKVTPQMDQNELHQQGNIERKMIEREAEIFVRTLDGIFREGGNQPEKHAEQLLLKYLESGSVRDKSVSVYRETSPAQERENAIQRLGEAVLVLSRLSVEKQDIDPQVSELLSRTGRTFSAGMNAVSGRNHDPASTFRSETPPADVYGSSDFGSDIQEDDETKA